MAIIKFINSKPTLETLINYVTKESKVFLVEGKDCLAEDVLDEMKSVKKAFQKEDGREFIHLIQSFSAKDNITPKKVHELGMKLAEKFQNYQVLVATHIDKDHIHSHLVINSVNFETGEKYQQSKQQMEEVILLILTSQMIQAVAVLLVALRTPKFLSEFMIIANNGGTGMSALASNTSRTIELTKQIQHLAK